MATTFPASKQDLLNPSPGTPTTDTTIPHAQLHTDQNDLVEAIQDKLGYGSAAQQAAVDTILRGIGVKLTDFGKVFNAHVDPAAAIAYSKLALANSIMNADINAAAAIAYAKLSLANSILDGDISPSAAIALTKIAHVGAGNVLRSDGTKNVAGKIQSGDIATDTIQAINIAAGAIGNSELGVNAVWNTNIQNGQIVGYDKLYDGSVTNVKIADSTILTGKIGTYAVGRCIGANSSPDGLTVNGSGGWGYCGPQVGMPNLVAGRSKVLIVLVGCTSSNTLGSVMQIAIGVDSTSVAHASSYNHTEIAGYAKQHAVVYWHSNPGTSHNYYANWNTNTGVMTRSSAFWMVAISVVE